MAQGRHQLTLGFGLSLGAILLVWSVLPFAQQVSKQGSGKVNLRMSDSLDSAKQGTREQSQPQSQKTKTIVTGGKRYTRGSGAKGVTLELSAGLLSDDNVFRTTSNEKRDVIMELKPKFYVDGRLGKHRFRLGYEGEAGRYQGFSGENYFDNKILSAIKFDLDRRLKANINTSLEYGHDQRGDVASRTTISPNPDRWHKHELGGDIVLGRRIAKAQIGLGYNLSGIRYMNNDQEARDFDDRNLRLFGRYNLTPKYALLGDVSETWSDYLDPSSNQSSKEYTGLIGVAWEATAKTSGEVKIGIRHRDFYTQGIPSTTGFAWDAKILWSPKSYSKVTAYTSRRVSPSARQGSTGLTSTDTYGLKWSHKLTKNLRFNSGLRHSQVAISESLKNRLLNFDAGFRYRMNRWIDFKANWNYSSLSASDGLTDYQANGVFIGFDAKLSRRLSQAKE